MLELWLFLHILAAIVAFGFGFYAPIMGAMAAKEPQHGNFMLRVMKRISDYVVIPVAISMAITGTLIVTETGGTERFQEAWLAIAIVIYIAAILTVLFVQRPMVGKLIELTSGPPGPDGPPAEVPQLAQRSRVVGLGLLVAIAVIVWLMVSKPTF